MNQEKKGVGRRKKGLKGLFTDSTVQGEFLPFTQLTRIVRNRKEERQNKKTWKSQKGQEKPEIPGKNWRSCLKLKGAEAKKRRRRRSKQQRRGWIFYTIKKALPTTKSGYRPREAARRGGGCGEDGQGGQPYCPSEPGTNFIFS